MYGTHLFFSILLFKQCVMFLRMPTLAYKSRHGVLVSVKCRRGESAPSDTLASYGVGSSFLVGVFAFVLTIKFFQCRREQ